MRTSIIGYGPRPTDSLWRPSAARKNLIQSTSKTHINPLDKPHSKSSEKPKKSPKPAQTRRHRGQIVVDVILLTLLLKQYATHEDRHWKASYRCRSKPLCRLVLATSTFECILLDALNDVTVLWQVDGTLWCLTCALAGRWLIRVRAG